MQWAIIGSAHSSSVSGERILLDSSSKLWLLVINLVSVPGGQLVNFHNAQSPRTLCVVNIHYLEKQPESTWKPIGFIKMGISWYIDLPSYLEQGESLGDLQMVDGADKMLDVMAGNENDVVIQISTEPFQGADVVVVTEKCDPYIGGAYYFFKHFEGQEINQNLWLCGVTYFDFGYLPEHIYVKRTV